MSKHFNSLIKKSPYNIFCFFMTIFLTACGGNGDGGGIVGGGGGGGGITPDTTSPTVSKTIPNSGVAITGNDSLVITFDETMDTTSLVFGGDMSSDNPGGTWSTSTKPVTGSGIHLKATDDTVTISPQSEWSFGNNRTLTIDAKDISGNALETLNFLFTVVEGMVHVSPVPAGDDANDGTKDSPKATIPAGIEEAKNQNYIPGAVLVSEGTYLVNSGLATPTHVILEEGISLFGGYPPDFSQRDLENFQTVIEDVSTRATSGIDDPDRALEAGSAITTATIVEGFMIKGSTVGRYTSGIFNHDGGFPTITNNRINGGGGSAWAMGMMNYNNASPLIRRNEIYSGSGGVSSIGIANIFSFPVIEGNIIMGATNGSQSIGIISGNGSFAEIKNNAINGGSGQSTYGIWTNSGASADIQNNTIHGGSGTGTYGIRNDETSPSIKNNTINGGSGTNSSYGIYNNIFDFFRSSSPIIQNNIVFTSGSGSGYCIYEDGQNADPASVQNNDLFDCPTAIYRDETTNLTDIDSVNVLTDTTATENVSINPAFIDIDGPDDDLNTVEDNDWHLTASSPIEITQGGLDLSADFTIDKDGTPRTVPWSIGAYEKD